jgi:MFS family permease
MPDVGRSSSNGTGLAKMSATAKRSAWTLVTLCAVLGLDGMDVASMNPTLPAIQEELGMSATSLQWVVSAYVIGYGGFVLLGGRLADFSRHVACSWSRWRSSPRPASSARSPTTAIC